jgi:hypothetical protein
MVEMDKKQSEKIQETNRRLDLNAGFHKHNCVRFGKNESYLHAKNKFEKCWELSQLGHTFVTEAENKYRDRTYDIIDLSTGEIWEFEKNHKIKKSGVTTIKI